MRLLLVLFILLGVGSESFAKNKNPGSGRKLKRGHWLTCWGGEETQVRVDPAFHKDTPEEEVASYIPKFAGSYRFEVKDTWEEWVTKSGTDCGRCGQTCTGDSKNQTCYCNSCTWQELETFYRPWSIQKVSWSVQWLQDQSYRQKRVKWLNDGKPKVNQDLNSLLKFDPERPLEYFLFPGEREYVSASNGGGFFSSANYITPTVSIGRARHKYDIQVQSSRGQKFLCDDVDFNMSATIRTGERVKGPTPNAIEFRGEWALGKKDSQGRFSEEPSRFYLTDVSAMRYEGQNKVDHYKEAQLEIELVHLNHLWWLIDLGVSHSLNMRDMQSRVKWTTGTDKTPPVAVYEIKSMDLFKTDILGNDYRLAYNESYAVCTKMRRLNNIYYDTHKLWFFEQWSEANCSAFEYAPPGQKDLRSGGQRVADFLSRLVGFGVF